MNTESVTALGRDTDDRALAELVRAFCAEHVGIATTRARVDDPVAVDPAIWSRFAVDLGLAGIAVPEDLGGAGGTLSSALIVAEELGAGLAGLPYLSTAITAVAVLLTCPPGRVRDGVLARIARDGAVVTVVDVVAGGDRAVADAAAADAFVVVARDEIRVLGRSEVAVTPHRAIDLTRRWGSVHLPPGDGGTLDGDAGLARRVLRTVRSAGLVADCAGGSRALVLRTVDYTRVREQFGRPIATYQAVKHACADLYVATEGIASFAARMREVLAGPAAHAPAHASADEVGSACAYATDEYRHIAEECLHLHGGIGFTWEHDAHLYLKRALASHTLFGRHRWHEFTVTGA